LADLRAELAAGFTTREIKVVGDVSEAFLALGVNADGWPSLSLHDEKGKHRIGLAINENGPALALYDETGRPRAGLQITKNVPSLNMFDASGKAIWFAP
jgi:hypothetical protein